MTGALAGLQQLAHDRTAQADERVHGLLRAVGDVGRDLEQRRTAVTTDLANAAEERERLLTSV